MTQTNDNIDLRQELHIVSQTNVGLAVAAGGNTTLLEFQVHGVERISVQFTVADNALDAFIVQGKVHPNAPYVTFTSVAEDYTNTPTGRIMKASGDLTTVAASGSGWFDMDVSGLQSVKILASGNGAATVSIWALGTAAG